MISASRDRLHIDRDSTTSTISRIERRRSLVIVRKRRCPTPPKLIDMEVYRVGPAVRIDCPAKVNLFLEVLAKRSDGFHEIETVIAAISIFDSLIVTENLEGRIQVHCDWAIGMAARRAQVINSGLVREGIASLPPETDNLVYKAAERLRVRAGISSGAAIRLTKRIPLEAGLGGASSDAAAALLALNVLWRLQWPRERLREIAAELGSDVPFFLLEEFPGAMAAICRGRGERVSRLAGVPRWHMVVVKPAAGLSTAAVYRRCIVPAAPTAASRLVEALRSGNLPDAGQSLFNRLQEVAEDLSPPVIELRRIFERLDVVGHAMSGSGTSYFAICRSAAHARHLAGRLRAERYDQVFYASMI